MKILIIKTHAIGDVLMTTPAIRAIRKKYPESHISMLVGEWSKEVVEGNPYLDNIITFKDNELLNFNLLDIKKDCSIYSLIKKLRVEQFDIIFMFHRSPFIHLVGYLIGAKERIGLTESKFAPLLTHKALCTKNSIHYAVIDYMKVAQAVGVNGDISLDIFIPDDVQEFTIPELSTLNSDLIGICPGGCVNPAEDVSVRRWSIENYAKLCDELGKRWLQPIIFGSISDILVANKLMELTTVPCINMCGKTNLKQLAALIKKCRVIVTNDSAPLHIAVAVGVPSVSLFGPTIGRARVPSNSNHITIQSKRECSPCYNNRRFPGCKNPICMEYIGVEEVLNSVLKLRES